MDKLGFSVEAGVKPAQRGCFSRLLSSVTGGGAIDYLMIVGGCSLAGVVGFKNFGDALDKDLNREAQLILGKETPISGPPQVPGQVTAVTAPGGLKPMLDGFVPPGTVFPACGVNGCTTCSQLGGEGVARVSLALSSEEGGARSNRGVQPGGPACAAAFTEPVPVSSERECQNSADPCDPENWLALGDSHPGLGNCNVEPTRDTRPPYRFNVKPKTTRDREKCNVTNFRVNADGSVQFCFKELKLKVTRGNPNKLQWAKECLDAASRNNSYCEEGEMEATYSQLSLDGKPISRVDLSPYALRPPVDLEDPCRPPGGADSEPNPAVWCRSHTQVEPGEPYKVVIPATVTGPPLETGASRTIERARIGSDDDKDFEWARRALAIQMLGLEEVKTLSDEQNTQINQKASCIKKTFQSSGFTWDHSSILRGADGNYYYELMLVPTAIHDTATHEGGSSWARSTVGAQDQKADEIWREKFPQLPAWDEEDPVLTSRYPNGDKPPPPAECQCE